VPENEEKIENEKIPETPEPNWKIIDEISNKLEKIFFEESIERKLSPYEMSVILSRLNLLFDEYKIMLIANHVQIEKPNVSFNGSNMYK